jgi:hypothetical protein
VKARKGELSVGDESKLNAAAARGARADTLLRNELLQEAFAALEVRYIEEWRVTQFRDTDARERLWQAVNIVRKVRDHLGAVLANGKLAQRELDDFVGGRRKS